MKMAAYDAASADGMRMRVTIEVASMGDSRREAVSVMEGPRGGMKRWVWWEGGTQIPD